MGGQVSLFTIGHGARTLEEFLDLLGAGGVKGFKEALEPFGLDPSEASFWKDSIDAHLGSLMEEAEALSKKLGYTA